MAARDKMKRTGAAVWDDAWRMRITRPMSNAEDHRRAIEAAIARLRAQDCPDTYVRGRHPYPRIPVYQWLPSVPAMAIGLCAIH